MRETKNRRVVVRERMPGRLRTRKGSPRELHCRRIHGKTANMKALR